MAAESIVERDFPELGFHRQEAVELIEGKLQHVSGLSSISQLQTLVGDQTSPVRSRLVRRVTDHFIEKLGVDSSPRLGTAVRGQGKEHELLRELVVYKVSNGDFKILDQVRTMLKRATPAELKSIAEKPDRAPYYGVASLLEPIAQTQRRKDLPARLEKMIAGRVAVDGLSRPTRIVVGETVVRLDSASSVDLLLSVAEFEAFQRAIRSSNKHELNGDQADVVLQLLRLRERNELPEFGIEFLQKLTGWAEAAAQTRRILEVLKAGDGLTGVVNTSTLEIRLWPSRHPRGPKSDFDPETGFTPRNGGHKSISGSMPGRGTKKMQLSRLWLPQMGFFIHSGCRGSSTVERARSQPRCGPRFDRLLSA